MTEIECCEGISERKKLYGCTTTYKYPPTLIQKPLTLQVDQLRVISNAVCTTYKAQMANAAMNTGINEAMTNT